MRLPFLFLPMSVGLNLFFYPICEWYDTLPSRPVSDYSKYSSLGGEEQTT